MGTENFDELKDPVLNPQPFPPEEATETVQPNPPQPDSYQETTSQRTDRPGETISDASAPLSPFTDPYRTQNYTPDPYIQDPNQEYPSAMHPYQGKMTVREGGQNMQSTTFGVAGSPVENQEVEEQLDYEYHEPATPEQGAATGHSAEQNLNESEVPQQDLRESPDQQEANPWAGLGIDPNKIQDEQTEPQFGTAADPDEPAQPNLPYKLHAMPGYHQLVPPDTSAQTQPEQPAPPFGVAPDPDVEPKTVAEMDQEYEAGFKEAEEAHEKNPPLQPSSYEPLGLEPTMDPGREYTPKHGLGEQIRNLGEKVKEAFQPKEKESPPPPTAIS